MCTRGLFHFAVVATLFQVLPAGEARRYRIIAGRKASTYEFPYQADLERMNRHWCGGSIIHRSFILTASHCVKSLESLKPVPNSIMQVRLGNDETLKGGSLHEIAEIIPHEKYSDYADIDQYDIALLRLRKPLEFNDRVQPVRLASVPPEPGDMGWVTGFGKTQMMRRTNSDTRHLMAVELPVVSLRRCRSILQNVADDMICAGFKKGHRDSCTGDSGGPYVIDDHVAGIVAWGIGCGREGVPGVYTNVAFYKPWIEAKIKAYGDP